MSFTKCRKHDWEYAPNGNKRCLVCGEERFVMDIPTKKFISNTVVDHEKRIRALELFIRGRIEKGTL